MNGMMILVTRAICVVLAVTMCVASNGCNDQPRSAGSRGSASPGGDPVNEVVEYRANDSRITLEVDRTGLTAVESIRFALRIEHPDSLTIDAVLIEDALPDRWTIRNREDEQSQSTSSTQSTTTITGEIEPFLPGSYTLAPVIIRAFPTNPGEDDSIGIEWTTSEIPIVVRSVLLVDDPEEAELAPITDVVDVPASRIVWIIGGASAAALLALALVLLFVLRRQAKNAEHAVQPIFIPVHELALRQLSELRGERLPQHGLFKPYYRRLSAIIRRYIENRFHVHAPERTTEEFLEEARASTRFTGDDLALFEEFLTHCDLVKFAEFEPTVSRADESAKIVEQFVNRTHHAEVRVEVDADPAQEQALSITGERS